MVLSIDHREAHVLSDIGPYSRIIYSAHISSFRIARAIVNTLFDLGLCYRTIPIAHTRAISIART